MNSRIIIILLLISSTFSYSQINELGISAGGSNYIGDVGDESYIDPSELYFGVIYKWNMTPRVAIRAHASYIKIADDDFLSQNAIRKARGYSFKNTISELALGIEFNYFNYSLWKKGLESTPYLIAELAIFNYNTVVKETTPNDFKTEGKMGFTVPVGIGYKTKIASSVGFGVETILRYTFADDLDYNNTDYPQLSFGNPNSNDWYITVGANLVFGFGRKSCYSDIF